MILVLENFSLCITWSHKEDRLIFQLLKLKPLKYFESVSSAVVL